MATSWEKALERWVSAGIVDSALAERIRAFEAAHGSTERLRWPVLLVVAFGGILLCAGVLLFVAAHWEEISPAWQFTLVLFLVASFPVAGAASAERFPALSLTFHAVGTVCVGAGIFLSAQIFNLQENWPNGILLWAIGALAGWMVLRNWSQAALLALLVPAWLVGEWQVRSEGFAFDSRLVCEGLLLLALTYLTGRTTIQDSPVRIALAWIGGLSILPLAGAAFSARYESYWWRAQPNVPPHLYLIGWAVALCVPLVLAFILRRGASWMNALAAVWVLVIATFESASSHQNSSLLIYAWDSIGPYLWAGSGAAGLIAWGIAEHRRERVNPGVAGFALTVGIFYFSDVMDKLGRSASLIGMGVLFLFGGWSLERVRRKLVARAGRSPA